MERLSSEGDPAIAVIVVTWNSEAVLPGLLISLPDGMAGTGWRLLVADNGSQDGSVQVAREAGDDVEVIELGTNRGFAAGVNSALERSGADDALVLNPDVRLRPGAGARLQRRLRRPAPDQPGTVGIAAPRLCDADGRLLPTLRREPGVGRALAETVLGVRGAGRLGLGEAVLSPAAYTRPAACDWISGAALMLSRECLHACGPWDESFFLYSEDADYALRARDRGFITTLEPQAEAVHLGGQSRTDPRLWSLLATNKVALYRKRHGAARAAIFRFASLLREARLGLMGNRPSRDAVRALLNRPEGR